MSMLWRGCSASQRESNCGLVNGKSLTENCCLWCPPTEGLGLIMAICIFSTCYTKPIWTLRNSPYMSAAMIDGGAFAFIFFGDENAVLRCKVGIFPLSFQVKRDNLINSFQLTIQGRVIRLNSFACWIDSFNVNNLVLSVLRESTFR